MMGIIIILGAGITVGYFYKRSVPKSQPKENIGTTKKSVEIGKFEKSACLSLSGQEGIRAFLCPHVLLKALVGQADSLRNILTCMYYVKGISCCAHCTPRACSAAISNAFVTTPTTEHGEEIGRK